MTSLFPNSMKDIQVTSHGDCVAVIMRTYNRPVLLVRALASVLQQTHQNWHLYLVNDGGDRAVLENVLKDHGAAFDTRLTVIHHDTNHGMEVASNNALQQAKSDFIVIHDDDDSWHPDFLRKTTAFLNASENHCYAAVLTHCEVITEELIDNHIIEKKREKWGLFHTHISLSDVLFSNVAPPISFLVRKSVIDIIGPFNPDLPVLGDWDYILRVIQVGDIGSIDEILAYYHNRIIQKNDSPYNNTVTAAIEQHRKYSTLYTNALIRAFLKSNPTALGLLRLSVLKSDERINALWHHNDARLNAMIHHNDAQFDDLKAFIKRQSISGKIKAELKRFKRKYLRR